MSRRREELEGDVVGVSGVSLELDRHPRVVARRGEILAHRALALAWILLTGGCAATVRVALPEEQRARLGRVVTVASLQQQELGVTIEPFNGGAAGGGLVGGLVGGLIEAGVNNSRTKDAEAAAVPVRNALVTHETAAMLRNAIAKEVVGVRFLGNGPVELRTVQDADAARALVATGDHCVLLVAAEQFLTPSFDAVVVAADVWLLPTQIPEETSPYDAALYKNTFLVPTYLPSGQNRGDLKENASAWAAEGGARARAALENGLADLARLVAFDLAQGPPTNGRSYGPHQSAERRSVRSPRNAEKIEGFVVRVDHGRAWVRVPSGVLYSIEAAFSP